MDDISQPVMITSEEKEQLSGRIKHWFQLQREIDTDKAALDAKKTSHKALTEDLLQFMRQKQLESFNIGGGDNKLERKIRRQKKAISNKFLLQQLQACCDTTDSATAIHEYIMTHRPAVEKDILKITR